MLGEPSSLTKSKSSPRERNFPSSSSDKYESLVLPLELLPPEIQHIVFSYIDDWIVVLRCDLVSKWLSAAVWQAFEPKEEAILPFMEWARPILKQRRDRALNNSNVRSSSEGNQNIINMPLIVTIRYEKYDLILPF